MKKRLILLIALLTMLATVAVAYSVAIALSQDNIKQLGATSQVSVSCPDSDNCDIESVSWFLTTSAPYMVDRIKITWDPHSGKTYTVCAELYSRPQTNPILLTGECKNGVTSSPTEIDFTNNVDPRAVDYVRIVIMEE